VGGGDPILFTDGRYTEQAHEEVIGARVLIEKKPPSHAAAEWLKLKRPGKLGVEGGHVTVNAEARLRALLPKPWHLRPTSGVVERHRMIKDAAEAELLRKAVQLGSSLFMPLLKAIRPGILETVVAAELEYAARRVGASGMALTPSSPQVPAPPCRTASLGQSIPRHGFVVLDFGVILAGYCSDMTLPWRWVTPTERGGFPATNDGHRKLSSAPGGRRTHRHGTCHVEQ